MHQSQRRHFKLHDCNRCGSKSTVGWMNERSNAGDDWLPVRPRCTNRACVLYNADERSAGDWDLSAAIRDVTGT